MKLRDDTDWPCPERSCYTVAELDQYWVDICPMIYNHRVILTPKAFPEGYAVGWCYPNLLAAVAAVMTWDPSTDQPEPAGYIKRVGELVAL